VDFFIFKIRKRVKNEKNPPDDLRVLVVFAELYPVSRS